MESTESILLHAAAFAANKHADQRRKNLRATPYINHPVEVAALLANEGGVTDLGMLVAAILHDTVEDTDTTFQEIEKIFGSDVKSLVAEVTDDKSLEKQRRKQLQVTSTSQIGSCQTAESCRQDLQHSRYGPREPGRLGSCRKDTVSELGRTSDRALSGNQCSIRTSV